MATKTMIDLGCGNAHYLTKKRFKGYKYIGIDNDPERVEKAKKKGIKLIDAKVPPIPLKKNTIDLVWSSHMIEHMSRDDQHVLVEEIARVCRKNARVLIKCPSIYNFCFYDEPTHQFAFTHRSLSVMFERAGFKTIKVGYTSIRWLPLWLQKYVRYIAMLPIPFFCWEVYYEGRKK